MTNEQAIKKSIATILKHPSGVVCKHWMIATVLSALEEAGAEHSMSFVKAIVEADDDIAMELLDQEILLAT